MDSDENIIYLLAVLTPMLAKRMMKTTRMRIESTPPVMVVYSGSPLYLRKVLLGKRSKNLRNLLKPERQEVIVLNGQNDSNYSKFEIIQSINVEEMFVNRLNRIPNCSSVEIECLPRMKK